MSDEISCDRVREIAADVAIGIADGQDRDAALRHAATCAECRSLIADLSRVVDDLLVLAPAQDPPPGFASRTVRRLVDRAPQPRASARARSRRWLPALAAASSFVAAIVLGSGIVLYATAEDRRLADNYRAVLAQADGAFFTAAPLGDSEGTLGTVYGYQGEPSWLFATINLPGPGTQRFEVQAITRTGEEISLGMAAVERTGTWGSALPVDLTEIVTLRFEATGGGRTLAADLNADDPWN